MFGLACSTIMDDDSPRKLKCFDLPGGPYTDLVLIEHRHGVMSVVLHGLAPSRDS
jgi:hypothetical protein